ncbi:hypothetical protein ACA910_001463 [Epithemia clementina (nom. ined.)]
MSSSKSGTSTATVAGGSANSHASQEIAPVSLVARPALHPASFDTLNPTRFNEIFLYPEEGEPVNKDGKNNNNDLTTGSSPDNYRYRLTVVDHPDLVAAVSAATPKTGRNNKHHKNQNSNSKNAYLLHNLNIQCPTAVFLIPAGRESEYMFRTQRGLQQVCQSAQAGRLIAVALGRSYSNYQNAQTVQAELTFVVQAIGRQGKFLPTAIQLSQQQQQQHQPQTIPFMALDGIGQRNVLTQGQSACSGSYLVEQIRAENNQWMRRLYFMSNPFVIQSEVYMKATTTMKPPNTPQESHDSNTNIHDLDTRSDDWVVDASQVSFEYHRIMAAGLLALACGDGSTTSTSTDSVAETESADAFPKQPQRGLIIGLGGGGLVTYMHFLLCRRRGHGHRDPPFALTCVELDRVIAQVACQYFGVPASHESLSHLRRQQEEEQQLQAGEVVADDNPSEGAASASSKPTGDDDDGVTIHIGNGLSIHVLGDTDARHNGSTVENDDNKSDPTTNANAISPSPPSSSSPPPLTYPAGYFSFIVVDVDSKDSTVGMSCPPIAFIQLDYLRRLAKLLAPPPVATTSSTTSDSDATSEPPKPNSPQYQGGGILAMNVAARDPAMLALVCDNIQKVFKCMVIADPNLDKKYSSGDSDDDEGEQDDDENVNVVIFASVHEDITKLSIAHVKQRLQHAMKHVDDAELKSDLEQSLLDAISRPTTSSTASKAAKSSNFTDTSNRNSNNKKKNGPNNSNNKKQGGKKKGKKK